MGEKTKVFISQGLRGKADPEAYIKKARKAVDEFFAQRNVAIQLIDTYFKDFNGNRVEFLGKAIQEGLSQADFAAFVDDWDHYAGCIVEHTVALRYDIPIVYVKTDEYAKGK
jgi:hypothetical protein